MQICMNKNQSVQPCVLQYAEVICYMKSITRIRNEVMRESCIEIITIIFKGIYVTSAHLLEVLACAFQRKVFAAFSNETG